MAAAEEIQDGLRQDGFEEYFDGAATDEAIIVGGFIVEMKDQFARGFAAHHFAGRGPNVGFDAAAADGAERGTILADEHAGAFVAGDGAVGVDDRGEGAALSGAPHADDFFEEVHGIGYV